MNLYLIVNDDSNYSALVVAETAKKARYMTNALPPGYGGLQDPKRSSIQNLGVSRSKKASIVFKGLAH